MLCHTLHFTTTIFILVINNFYVDIYDKGVEWIQMVCRFTCPSHDYGQRMDNNRGGRLDLFKSPCWTHRSVIFYRLSQMATVKPGVIRP